MEGTETLILLEEVLSGKINDQKLYNSRALSLHLMLVNSSLPVVRAAGMIAARLKQQKNIHLDNYYAFQRYIQEIISGSKPKSLEITQHTFKNDLDNKAGKLIFCISKLYKLYTSNLLSSFFALKLHMAKSSVSLINKHTSYCRFFLVFNNRCKIFMKHILQNWKEKKIVRKLKPLTNKYRNTQIQLKILKKILLTIKPTFESIAFWRWKIRAKEYKDIKNNITEAAKKSEMFLRHLLYKTVFGILIIYQNKSKNLPVNKIGTTLSIAKNRYFSLQLLSMIKWRKSVKKIQKTRLVTNNSEDFSMLKLRNITKNKNVLGKIVKRGETKYLQIKHKFFMSLCFNDVLGGGRVRSNKNILDAYKNIDKGKKIINTSVLKLAFRSLMKLKQSLIHPFFHIWKNIINIENSRAYNKVKDIDKAFYRNDDRTLILLKSPAQHKNRSLNPITTKFCPILFRTLYGFITKRVRNGIESIKNQVAVKKSCNQAKLYKMMQIISNICKSNIRKVLKPNKKFKASYAILKRAKSFSTKNTILPLEINIPITTRHHSSSSNLNSTFQSQQIPKTLHSLSTLTSLLTKKPALSLNQSFKNWKLYKFLLPKLLKKIITRIPISYKTSFSLWYSTAIHPYKKNFTLIKNMTIATQNYINRLKQFAIFKLVMFSTFCPQRVKNFSLSSIGSLNTSDIKAEDTEIISFISTEDKSFNERRNPFSISTSANSRFTKYDMINNDQNWALQLLSHNIKSVLLRRKMFGLTCIEIYARNMLEFDEEREILYEEINDLRYDKITLLEDNAMLRMYNEDLVESLEKTNSECLLMSDLVKETKLSRMVALLGKMLELPMLEVIFTLRSNNNFYML